MSGFCVNWVLWWFPTQACGSHYRKEKNTQYALIQPLTWKWWVSMLIISTRKPAGFLQFFNADASIPLPLPLDAILAHDPWNSSGALWTPWGSKIGVTENNACDGLTTSSPQWRFPSKQSPFVHPFHIFWHTCTNISSSSDLLRRHSKAPTKQDRGLESRLPAKWSSAIHYYSERGTIS